MPSVGGVGQMSSADEPEGGGSSHTIKRRNRPAKVCRPCQKRKTKCDMRWPLCSFCEKNGIPCSWDSRLYGANGLISRKSNPHVPNRTKQRSRMESLESLEKIDPISTVDPVPVTDTPSLAHMGNPLVGASGLAHISAAAESLGVIQGVVGPPQSLAGPSRGGAGMGDIGIGGGVMGSTGDTLRGEAAEWMPDGANSGEYGVAGAGPLDGAFSAGGSGGSEEDVKSILPVRAPRTDAFAAYDRFMEVLSRLNVVEGLFSMVPQKVEALSQLSFLWTSYIFEGINDDNTSTIIVKQPPEERISFYNSFTAMISFAYGSIFFSEEVSMSIFKKTSDVAWALASKAVEMLRYYNDRLTNELLGAFAIMIHLSLFSPSGYISDGPIHVFGVLKGLLAKQFGDNPSTYHTPDVYTLMTACEIFVPDERRSNAQSLDKLANLITVRAKELRENLPWSLDRIRGFAVASLFSAEVIISRFFYDFDPVTGDVYAVQFRELPLVVKQLLVDQVAELEAVEKIYAMKEVPEGLTGSRFQVIRHCIIGLCAYYQLFIGTMAAAQLREKVIGVVRFFLTEWSCGHPFNTAAFGPMGVSIACLHEVDPRALRQLLLVETPALTAGGQRLTSHGQKMRSLCELFLHQDHISLHDLLSALNFVAQPTKISDVAPATVSAWTEGDTSEF